MNNVGAIIDMKESDDEDEEKFNRSQGSKESTDSIDGDPHMYVNNDNYFAQARQINKGILIKDINKGAPDCKAG